MNNLFIDFTFVFFSSSSSFNNEIDCLPLKKIANNEKQLTKHEINQISIENETTTTTKPEIFHDDTSKLTFREKMTLFNKNKNNNTSTNTFSLKTSRNRLTQVKFSLFLSRHTRIR